MAPDHVSIIRDVSGIRLVYTRLMNSVILLVRGGERFSWRKPVYYRDWIVGWNGDYFWSAVA